MDLITLNYSTLGDTESLGSDMPGDSVDATVLQPSNSSDSSHPCPEDPFVDKAILDELPTGYTDFTITMLNWVIMTSKEHYNEYATRNHKILSSCPEPDSVLRLLLQMGEDTRKELHGLIIQHKFAALVYHDSLRNPAERWGPNNRAQPSYLAFGRPYKGDAHYVLVDTMDFYTGKQNIYNRCISVVQSSGHGKSRMVKEASLLRFALPFNLRGKLPGGYVAYPPPDNRVRDYFSSFNPSYPEKASFWFITFLEALFIEVEGVLSLVPDGTANFATRWFEYLNAEETSVDVGTNRTKLYDQVIAHAELLFKERSRKPMTDEHLITSCTRLVYKLRMYTGQQPTAESPSRAVFFVYFDECHQLQELTFNIAIRLSLFGHDCSARPPSPARIPSLRRVDALSCNPEQRLIPPYTELPFDIFANNVGYSLPLAEYAKWEVFSMLGRPLWHCGLNKEVAYFKLGINYVNDRDTVHFACLAILVHLEFDSKREIARNLESELVESYMRTVFAVPEHREYMRTGYPSEPCLVEGAAKMLRQSGTPFRTICPKTLANAIRSGFIERGKNGELATRLLYIIARYEVFVKNAFKGSPTGISPNFHTPIKLIDFVLALAPKRFHEKILQGKPTSGETTSTFQDAFKDAYVNFTHFQLAGEIDIIKHKHIWKALRRSIAFQCRDNQMDVGNALPIFFGDPTSIPINEMNTSVQMNQTDNRVQPAEPFVDPAVVEVKSPHPILTLVMEHRAVPSDDAERWEVSRIAPMETQSSQHTGIHERHYQFIIRGCDSATYAVIPEETEPFYQSILAEASPFDDFPRGHLARNLRLSNTQKPCFYVDQL